MMMARLFFRGSTAPIGFVLVFMLGCALGCSTIPTPESYEITEPGSPSGSETDSQQVAERSSSKSVSEPKSKAKAKSKKDSTKERRKEPEPPSPQPPTEESLPVETLDVPPDTVDPLPHEENPDPLIEAEDVALHFPKDALRLDHGILQIAFSAKDNIAFYSRYELTAEQLRARFIKRDTDPFTPDPILQEKLPGAVVTKATYTRSHMDRGHLAPAEDMSWNADGFFASFYMSNMAPQKGRLNQQSWKRLEERVRDWACGEEHVTVVTGPILGKNPRLLRKQVPVPEAFFKVVIDETPPRKIAAFVYQQDDPASTLPLQRQVSIAQLNQRVGYALLPSAKLKRLRLTSLETWKTGACRELKTQVSAKRLLRERKLDARLGRTNE